MTPTPALEHTHRVWTIPPGAIESSPGGAWLVSVCADPDCEVAALRAQLAVIRDHPPEFIVTSNGVDYRYRLMALGPLGTWSGK